MPVFRAIKLDLGVSAYNKLEKEAQKRSTRPEQLAAQLLTAAIDKIEKVAGDPASKV